MHETFRCVLVTPEQQVLDEQVIYASIPAWDGQLGLMPDRAPLLAKLGDGALRLDFKQGGSRWFYLGSGFAQMKDNELSLVTPEAVPAEMIVHQDALAALREAEARVAVKEDDLAAKNRQVRRAHSLLALFERHGNKV